MVDKFLNKLYIPQLKELKMIFNKNIFKGLIFGANMCSGVLFGETNIAIDETKIVVNEKRNVTVIVDEQGNVTIDNNGRTASLNVPTLVQQLRSAHGGIQMNSGAGPLDISLLATDLKENPWITIGTSLNFAFNVNISGEVNLTLQKIRKVKKMDCLRVRTPKSIRVSYDTRKLGFQNIEINADKIDYIGLPEGNKPHQSIYLEGNQIVLDQLINAVSCIEVDGMSVRLAPKCLLVSEEIIFNNNRSKIIPSSRASSFCEINGCVNVSGYLTINNYDRTILDGQFFTGSDLRILTNHFTNNGQCNVGNNCILLTENVINNGQVDIKNSLTVFGNNFINKGSFMIANNTTIRAHVVLNEESKAIVNTKNCDIIVDHSHYDIDLFSKGSTFVCGRNVISFVSSDPKQESEILIDPTKRLHN